MQEFSSLTLFLYSKEITFTTYGEQVKAKNRLRHRTVDGEEAVIIDVQEPVSLKFGSQYLFYFSKAAPLSAQVSLFFLGDQG